MNNYLASIPCPLEADNLCSGSFCPYRHDDVAQTSKTATKADEYDPVCNFRTDFLCSDKRKSSGPSSEKTTKAFSSSAKRIKIAPETSNKTYINNERDEIASPQKVQSLKAIDFSNDEISTSIMQSANALGSTDQTSSTKRTAHQDFRGCSLLKKPNSHNVPRPSNVILSRLSPSSQSAPTAPSRPAEPSNGRQRVAHVPQVPNSSSKALVIPSIMPLPTSKTKVPLSLRQKCCTDLLKFCIEKKIMDLNMRDIMNMVQEKEKDCAQGCNTTNMYTGNLVKIKKKIAASVNVSTSTKSTTATTVSHSSILDGKLAKTCTFEINKNAVDTEFTESEFIAELKSYLMTEEQLIENCFPRKVKDPKAAMNGDVVIKPSSRADAQHKMEKIDTFKGERRCIRCKLVFRVNVETGKPLKISSNPSAVARNPNECCYHWGRPQNVKLQRGVFETKMSCCGADPSAPPCSIAPFHVHEFNKENFKGYLSADPATQSLNGSPKVNCICLDCEMVYTTRGLEVGRISGTDRKGDAIIDVICRVDGVLLDSNQRFSGLTPEMVNTAKFSQLEARKKLLEMMRPDTILVGHSLESDLVALRIRHDAIVDTSIVFPHPKGPPLKRALKTLALEILQKIIQEDLSGHDSLEDGRVCAQLMDWRLKQDRKQRNSASATISKPSPISDDVNSNTSTQRKPAPGDIIGGILTRKKRI